MLIVQRRAVHNAGIEAVGTGSLDPGLIASGRDKGMPVLTGDSAGQSSWMTSKGTGTPASLPRAVEAEARRGKPKSLGKEPRSHQL